LSVFPSIGLTMWQNTAGVVPQFLQCLLEELELFLDDVDFPPRQD
jgi:hypothetical protein